jgi:hypothetical protein
MLLLVYSTNLMNPQGFGTCEEDPSREPRKAAPKKAAPAKETKTMRFDFTGHSTRPNAKLTDDDERAKGIRVGTKMCPRSSAFDPATGSGPRN